MKIVFMGTPDFASEILRSLHIAGHEIVLVVSQPDRPRGRGSKMQATSVKECALELGLEVYQPKKIKEQEAIDYLKDYNADVFVVAAFGQILPKAVLDMPKECCINVHASLLPKYRGASPIQRAVLNGDKVSGVTIMKMAEGMDTGDIILQKEIKLNADETAGSLFERLATLGGEACNEALDLIENNTATYTAQDNNKATYTKPIKKEEGLIDFNQDAITIERLIRGMNPWPSAFTYLDSKMLKVWSASVSETKSGKPGEVISVGKEGIEVATTDASIVLKEVQLAGKKRMSADAFLRGYSIEVGTLLGKRED